MDENLEDCNEMQISSRSYGRKTKQGITKDIRAQILFEGYQLVYSHRDTFKSSRVCVEKLKTELITAERSVEKLQQQLLEY